MENENHTLLNLEMGKETSTIHLLKNDISPFTFSNAEYNTIDNSSQNVPADTETFIVENRSSLSSSKLDNNSEWLAATGSALVSLTPNSYLKADLTLLNNKQYFQPPSHSVQVNYQNDEILKPYSCSDCGKSFRRSDHLKVHQTTHSDVRPHNCGTCGKSFTRLEHLKKHIQVHSGIKPFKCNDCGKSFGRSENLKNHLVVHSGIRPFVCQTCGKSFGRTEHLKNHLMTHSGVKPFKCTECGKEFGRSDNLQRHLLTHSGVRPHKCQTCGKTYCRIEHLKKHIITHSILSTNNSEEGLYNCMVSISPDIEIQVGDEAQTKKFNAQIYTNLTPPPLELINLVKDNKMDGLLINTDDESHSQCSNYNNKQLLKTGYTSLPDMLSNSSKSSSDNFRNYGASNIEVKVEMINDESSADVSLIEPFLNSAYVKEEIKLDEISDGVELHRQLELYKNSIIGEHVNLNSLNVQAASASRPYSCSQCGKRYIRLEHLRRHELTHSAIKPHKCEDCGRCFGRLEHLRNHMITHTGIKAFKCEECGKEFGRLENLKRHETTHSDLTPFPCPMCGKAFARTEHLKNHLITHSGIRPFKCEECGKTFARNEHLKNHLFTHTGIKPFKCEDCGKSFARNEHLKNHLMTHSGIKPYRCEDCGKNFGRSEHLKRHQLTHSDIKPYTCDYCGKEFGRLENLKKHKLTHEKTIYNGSGYAQPAEKEYKCECGKEFARKEHLKNHQITHSGVKPFKCDDCGKSFGRSEHLKRHKVTHSEVRPHKCNECGKEFGRIDHLKKHQTRHSNNVSEISQQYCNDFKQLESFQQYSGVLPIVEQYGTELGRLYNIQQQLLNSEAPFKCEIISNAVKDLDQLTVWKST